MDMDIFEKLSDFFKQIILDIISANLKDMLIDINDKVGLVVDQVGKTPSNWNASVFAFVKNINGSVILPVAGLVLTAVLCLEVINMVMRKNNMHDTDTFEFFKVIIKMWVAVYLVTHAFDFSMAVFDLAQRMVSQAAGVINTSHNLSAEGLVAMVDQLKDKDIGTLLAIAAETAIIKLCIQAISILIMVIVYGRMFEIYVYCSISALPFSTMGNREWGSIGHNYIRGLFALGLQGVFLLICMGIFAVLIKTIKLTDIHTATFSILAHSFLLGLMMMKSGSLAKSIMNAH